MGIAPVLVSHFHSVWVVRVRMIPTRMGRLRDTSPRYAAEDSTAAAHGGCVGHHDDESLA